MAKQKKITKLKNVPKLEEQYAEIFKAPTSLFRWLPLPESVSLEQPSPFEVVPMISADSVGEQLG